MDINGYLRKMNAQASDVVQYSLVTDSDTHALNEHIGEKIHIEFLGKIVCQMCGRQTQKSFNQGYCFVCFKALARNDRCVMSPHLCHFAQGTCREPEWGMAHCMQPHVVYLSWTSTLKVGITKPSQIPTRWIDQGALAAVPLCHVSSRYHSGLVEEYLKTWYDDRTNWRKMLVADSVDVDLLDCRAQARKKIEEGDFPQVVVDGLVFSDDPVTYLEYPVDATGLIKSLSLDKQRIVSGYLLGIKGQYLILDSGVINLRKHTSYDVCIRV